MPNVKTQLLYFVHKKNLSKQISLFIPPKSVLSEKSMQWKFQPCHGEKLRMWLEIGGGTEHEKSHLICSCFSGVRFISFNRDSIEAWPICNYFYQCVITISGCNERRCLGCDGIAPAWALGEASIIRENS